MDKSINKSIKKTENKKGLKGLLSDLSFLSIITIGIPSFTIAMIIEYYILSFLVHTGKVTEKSLNNAVNNEYVIIISLFIVLIGLLYLNYRYVKLREYILNNYKKGD